MTTETTSFKWWTVFKSLLVIIKHAQTIQLFTWMLPVIRMFSKFQSRKGSDDETRSYNKKETDEGCTAQQLTREGNDWTLHIFKLTETLQKVDLGIIMSDCMLLTALWSLPYFVFYECPYRKQHVLLIASPHCSATWCDLRGPEVHPAAEAQQAWWTQELIWVSNQCILFSLKSPIYKYPLEGFTIFTHTWPLTSHRIRKNFQ